MTKDGNSAEAATQQMRTRRRLRYVVIGGGMAGILSAIRLNERKNCDFVVYEKRAKIGGTWHDNRYPGLYCDVPAHAYTYSFAPYAEWSGYFAPGPEIREYLEHVIDTHGIRSFIQLNSEVVSCDFSDNDGQWHLELRDGRRDVADVVIVASGVLHHPHIPDLPGLDAFKGQWCHSAEWRDDIVTKNRKIGVIGTGSTGVQIVTALGAEAAHITHFARTPQWILALPQFAYTEEQREAFRRDTALIDEIRFGEEYQGFLKGYYTAIVDPSSPEYAALQRAVEQNLEEGVRDPELREKLRPDYLPMCKRLVMSSGYYDAIQLPQATLEIGKIDRIEENGIRMKDGTLHELDLIVLATGFKVDSFIRPAVVHGEGGVSLDEAWADRPVAYRSVAVPGFPNLFFLNGPNSPVGNFSLIEIAELQWNYFSQLFDRLENGNTSRISPTKSALDRFESARTVAAKGTIFASGCTSWYLDKQGNPAGWPWSFDVFKQTMTSPDLDDYNFC